MVDRLSADRAVSELAPLIGDRVVILHQPAGPQNDPLSGSDIDCAVRSIHGQWPLRARGWRLVQCLHYDLRGWFWVLEREGRLVAFDTIDDPYGLGRDGIRTSALLGGSWDLNPSPAVRAAYLAVKRTRKRSTAASEWARIGRLANDDPGSFSSALTLAAGEQVAGILRRPALAGEPPDAASIAEANLLRHRRRFGSPARITRGLAYASRRYANRFLRPSGLTILVVGPDGSGKSSLAAAVVDACQGMFKRHEHQHWRPQILPRPGSVIARPPSDPSEPHARPPYGRLPSMALLAYYWLDFMIGASTKEAVFRVRSGLVVRERGWWDIAVDPARYRLSVPEWLVRAGAALMPRPDLVLILEGPPETLAARKPELKIEEIARQSLSWRTILPRNVNRRFIDVSRPFDEVREVARDTVCAVMEARAVSRLGAGWLALPGREPRWWLPRGPGRVAAAGLTVYQPVTPRGRAAWRAGRAAARAGAGRLVPRGSAPPRRVRDLVSPAVPPRGTIAVSRGTHEGRYTAVIIDGSGAPSAFAKIDLSSRPASLEREAKLMGELASYLPPSLTMPQIRSIEPRMLVLQSLAWRVRDDPSRLPPDLAQAVGRFFSAGHRDGPEGPEGPTHGDFAPWNVLEVDGGWALVDWEAADRFGPAFDDVFHYLVQGYSLLGAPGVGEIVSGVRGRGPLAHAIELYASSAGVPVSSAEPALASYLGRSRPDPSSSDRSAADAIARRDELASRLGA